MSHLQVAIFGSCVAGLLSLYAITISFMTYEKIDSQPRYTIQYIAR